MQAFGPLEDVATFDGADFAFLSFHSVQPACRAFELLDGQQVTALSGCFQLSVASSAAPKDRKGIDRV